MTFSPALTRRGFVLGAAALYAARPAHAQAPLVLRAEKADLPLGQATLSTPAFNTLSAGPLIEIEQGKPFALKIENRLDFEFHFRPQGLRGKAVEGAIEAIKPGETRDITITPPDAGSFVYRAGSEGGLNITQTILLAGPLIVRAEQPRIADSEIILALNAFTVPGADETSGALRIVTVNGSPGLEATARPGERIRLRVVNLAQEGLGALRVPKEAQIVALDGQPCEPFPPFDGALVVGPLGRADLLIDAPNASGTKLELVDHFDPAHVLVSIAIAGDKMGDRFLAKQLPDNRGLPKEMPFQRAERFTWKPLEAPPDMSVKRGASVIVTFENNTTPHALLLEGHSARLLDAMDDGWKPWWNDSILLPPDETQRFAFVPDAPGRFALDLIPLEGNGAPTRAIIDVA
ncbi:multicopper oxidase [Terrihabitans soli]|uniref:Multicopper oxidase n=1 Tax=Terrihabitans soli TaxID=708113 RepID=A0A6S6QW39_9HYPH|nr:multicopper oxidase domain-containing protein [Terrihabitans soli]BCJ90728.1 multicopper oxidase [Terrihabitans soli]